MQDGDAQVFSDVFEQHARQVFAFCGRRTGDWRTAEDLASVVFLEAWRCRSGAFAGDDGSLLPWLLGIARNVTAMSRRSLRRHDAALARLGGQAEARGVADDVDDSAVRNADHRRIGRAVGAAVQRLSREQRAVTELCLLGGLTVRQAADALSVPASVVSSRLADSRAKLRRLLRSREIEDPSWLVGNDVSERHRGAADERAGTAP